MFTFLLQYAAAMGNHKPPALTRVEHYLRHTLLNIAAGVPALEALQTFLEQFKEVKAQNSKILNLDWFARGKYKFLCSLHNPLTNCIVRTINCYDRVSVSCGKHLWWWLYFQ